MGAPTWPPTPEAAHRATRDEYGEAARAVLAFETDEEAEVALLRHFLHGTPPKELGSGEAVGTTLVGEERALSAWLRMVSGAEVSLAASDPPTTDGRSLFLPAALPAPARPAEDSLLYRGMALLQLGLLQWGFLQSRALLAELHRDWVYRSCYHLLAARAVCHLWARGWPGIAADLRAVGVLDAAGLLRVNVARVPLRSVPADFLPLYEGLLPFVGPAGAAGEAARQALAAVDRVSTPAAAPLVVAGQAQALRAAFRQRRLGPPPLPAWLGVIRPEWLLHDLRAELQAGEAWKAGPKPLQLLQAAMRRGEGPGGVPERLRALLRGASPPPRAAESGPSDEAAPPPEADGSSVYDEWSEPRGRYRLGVTRVVEVDAPSGSLEPYQRLADAHRAERDELRRRFSALRVEPRWLHAQPDGAELDLDRAISAAVDRRAGHSGREDWHTRFVRERSAVAILVLVDVSGSTQGEIIRLEQTALILLEEGLDALGFPHAIYGFSNQGPRDCRFQRIQAFGEPRSEAVFRRLGNLRAGGATRLGAFLRHAGRRLQARGEAKRLLLVLSDGRPHCEGEYRDSFGVRDSAMAVAELRSLGVLTHFVSLDRQARAADYLREISGPTGFLILERPDELPRRLPEVLRRLLR